MENGSHQPRIGVARIRIVAINSSDTIATYAGVAMWALALWNQYGTSDSLLKTYGPEMLEYSWPYERSQGPATFFRFAL
jgi:hypothetical protein